MNKNFFKIKPNQTNPNQTSGDPGAIGGYT